MILNQKTQTKIEITNKVLDFSQRDNNVVKEIELFTSLINKNLNELIYKYPSCFSKTQLYKDDIKNKLLEPIYKQQWKFQLGTFEINSFIDLIKLPNIVLKELENIEGLRLIYFLNKFTKIQISKRDQMKRFLEWEKELLQIALNGDLGNSAQFQAKFHQEKNKTS